MADLDLISGVTETQPQTEPITARLVRLLEDNPRRSQDALADGVADLEEAYSLEPNAKVRNLIEEVLDMLRNGPSRDSVGERASRGSTGIY
jgi:hypothetical protein